MTDQTGLDVSDRRGDEAKGRKTTGHDPVSFDCEYCEVVLQTRSVEAMKDRGTTHLETHKPTLFDVFASKHRGKGCQNDCGYVFPGGGDQATGFECPKCGYDNFEEFAARYLYWQIEFPESRPVGAGRE